MEGLGFGDNVPKFPDCPRGPPPCFDKCLQCTLASNEPGLTFSVIFLKSRLAPGLYRTTTCVHNVLPVASMPNPNETPIDCVSFQTTCMNCAAFCVRITGSPKPVLHISSYLKISKVESTKCDLQGYMRTSSCRKLTKLWSLLHHVNFFHNVCTYSDQLHLEEG